MDQVNIAGLYHREKISHACLPKGHNSIQNALDDLEKSGLVHKKATRFKAIFIDEIGNIYRKEFNQFDQAITYYEKAKEINLKINNISGIGRNLSHIGCAYWELDKKEKAISFLKKGLEQTQKTKRDKRGVGVRLCQLGFFLAKTGQIEKGIEMLFRGLEINVSYNDHRTNIKNLIKLAEIYTDQDEFISAENFLRKAFSIAQKFHYEDLEILISIELGSILCDFLESFEEGYNHYYHAFKLHQKSWNRRIEYIPEIESFTSTEHLKLMYESLISGYHKDSSKIIELLNGALKKAFKQSAEKEQLILVSAVHRLRTPITAIRNYFDFIQEKKDQLKKKEILDHIGGAYKNLQNIELTVNDFLEETKAHAKKPIVFFPHQTIRLIIESYEHQYPGIEIVLSSTDEEVSLECFGDRDALETAFKEILLNACQASTLGKKVFISINLIEKQIISITNTKFNLVINVKDTGIGISPKDLKNIFKPRFTTKPSGKGLGLKLASKVIRGGGGFIKVESNTTTGCMFTITLPVNKVN